ncbi:hypothetical protein E2C01_081550 [Portunus trituberculatus]|uniref:Uncharacterized protein n=1 Tax=Portunus trituberculatus TaxID=210409 RepID=A0A5B7J2L6_PORTR|nr:hypothetical protein [Portunus trituberculatus]
MTVAFWAGLRGARGIFVCVFVPRGERNQTAPKTSPSQAVPNPDRSETTGKDVVVVLIVVVAVAVVVWRR